MAVTTIGSIARRHAAEEVSAPWWNRRAVRYLSQRLRPGDRVFEWGSGGSTVWLIRQGAKVTSVEHDPDWSAKVTARCPTADIRTIPGATAGRFRSERHLRDKGQHFFDDYIAAIDPVRDESLDVLVVDGLCRIDCLRRGAPKVKPGGILVLDDSDFGFLAPAVRVLPGWRPVSLSGFKTSTRDFRDTTFFHRPG